MQYNNYFIQYSVYYISYTVHVLYSTLSILYNILPSMSYRTFVLCIVRDVRLGVLNNASFTCISQ